MSEVNEDVKAEHVNMSPEQAQALLRETAQLKRTLKQLSKNQLIVLLLQQHLGRRFGKHTGLSF